MRSGSVACESATGADDPWPWDLESAAKKKALFSVGGWTGSVYFSSLVATSTSRAAFAKTILNFTTTYGFDGVDLDW